MNGKVLSVKLSETLGFSTSKRVEKMSQLAQSLAMDSFLDEDVQDASDENYSVGAFLISQMDFFISVTM